MVLVVLGLPGCKGVRYGFVRRVVGWGMVWGAFEVVVECSRGEGGVMVVYCWVKRGGKGMKGLTHI